jgi:hypothetical protein
MKPALLLLFLATLSACVIDDASRLESRFSRERTTLTRFEGPTSEQSCSGAALSVYLRGQQVRHLDWSVETSTQFIRRQYFFDGAIPGLVVETIHARLDSHAEPLNKPHLLSTERYQLNAPQASTREKELRDHAKFLIDDFNKHRKEFSRRP